MYISLIFVHRFNKIQLSALTGSFCFIFQIQTPEKYKNTVLFLFEYVKCLQGVQKMQLFKAGKDLNGMATRMSFVLVNCKLVIRKTLAKKVVFIVLI